MKNKILFVVCVLYGLLFINAGLNKFFNYMPPPDNLSQSLLTAMTAIMQIKWLMPLIGIAEIIGGLLIIFPKTRALAALILFPVVVGIFLTATVTDTTSLPIALVVVIVLAWIMYENRAKYLPLVR